MKSIFLHLSVVALGFSLGMATMTRLQKPPQCPPCPDVTCPEAVSLNLNRQDLSSLKKLKLKNSTVDQRIVIEGEVNLTIVDCQGETRSLQAPGRGMTLDSLVSQLMNHPQP